MTHTLRVISFNIWGLWRISQDREQRIRAFAALLPTLEVDMIALQELWVDEDQKFLVRQAHNAGLIYAHYFRSGTVGSGLLTLSRHPITEVAFYPYRLRSRPELITQGDFWAGKGIGLTRIVTPAGEVDFYNTHAVAQYAPDYQDTLAAVRAANMYDAVNFINAQSQCNPVILAGDYNVNPRQMAYHILTTLACLTDCYDYLHPDDPSITFSLDNPYNRHYREPERIDYVMVRDGVQLSAIPTHALVTLKHQPDYPFKPYSDHYAVQVEVALAPCTTPLRQCPPEERRPALELLLREIQNGLDNALARYQRHRWHGLIALALSLFLNPRRYQNDDPTRKLLRSWGAVLALQYALVNAALHFYFVTEEIQLLRAILSEIRLKIRATAPIPMKKD